MISDAFSSVACLDLKGTPGLKDAKNELNSAVSLLGSPPGRTNPPITLAPLHQEVCFVQPCAHSTTSCSAVYPIQFLEGFGYFLLGCRPLPVRDHCLLLIDFESRNFSLP